MAGSWWLLKEWAWQDPYPEDPSASSAWVSSGQRGRPWEAVGVEGGGLGGWGKGRDRGTIVAISAPSWDF